MRPNTALFRFAGFGLVSSLLGSLALMSSGLGYRCNWWGIQFAFELLKYSVFVELFSLLLCACLSIFSYSRAFDRTFSLSTIGLAISILSLAIPVELWRTVKHLPKIHDISTDTSDPPQFMAILPMREKEHAPNSPVYGGPRIAEQQKEAYPDIKPWFADLPPEMVFSLAMKVAHLMNWEIVAAIPPDRIEATATTFWFHFKDDVVIRIQSRNHITRLDIRSESRVGLSDIGANGKRIRKFLRLLTAESGSSETK